MTGSLDWASILDWAFPYESCVIPPPVCLLGGSSTVNLSLTGSLDWASILDWAFPYESCVIPPPVCLLGGSSTVNLSLTGSLDWALLLDLSYFSIIDPRAPVVRLLGGSSRISPWMQTVLHSSICSVGLYSPTKRQNTRFLLAEILRCGWFFNFGPIGDKLGSFPIGPGLKNHRHRPIGTLHF